MLWFERCRGGGGEVGGMDQIQHNHIISGSLWSAAVIDIWFCRICAPVLFPNPFLRFLVLPSLLQKGK